MVQKLIPSHVWPLVLPHLREPIPEALSEAPRIDLRQEHLAMASRMCKLFNDICRPLLYANIVTDDLPRLLTSMALPSPHNRQRFARTRTLAVEYSDKTSEPSYISLCKDGGAVWRDCGLDEGRMEAYIRIRCEQEVHALIGSLTSVNDTGPGIFFPRLQTLAIGSIYGDSTHFWTAKLSQIYGRRMTIDLSTCMLHFENFAAALRLRHLCIRDVDGPLIFPNSPHNSPRPKTEHHPITTTIHLSLAPSYFPLPLGYPIRYTVDSTNGDDWATTLRARQCYMNALTNHRKTDLREGYAFRPADIVIFCSTELSLTGDFSPSIESFGVSSSHTGTHYFSAADQADMAARLGKTLQARLARDSGLPDKVKWRTGDETPICKACGSGRPV